MSRQARGTRGRSVLVNQIGELVVLKIDRLLGDTFEFEGRIFKRRRTK